MLLISNNVLEEMPVPHDAVVRINIAWVDNAFHLEAVLSAIEQDVLLDFPEGREKPPVPKTAFLDILKIAEEDKKVKYIAVSNIESPDVAAVYTRSMPEGVQFVPKIETQKGVKKLPLIIDYTGIKYIMLDTEDLFMDLKGDAEMYTTLIDSVAAVCKSKGVTVLKIAGVVFTPWEGTHV